MKQTQNSFSVNDKELSRFARALSHPARIKILKHLMQCKCCFTGNIVDILPLAQSTVSQHLKELKKAGLIQGEISHPRVKYCIDRENFHKAQQLFAFFFNSFED